MRRTFFQLGMKREIGSIVESGIDLSTLFSNREDAEIYCFFVIWYCEFRKSPLKEVKGGERLSKGELEFMEFFPQICLGAFDEFAVKVQKRLVTVGALSKCTSNPLVHPALAAQNFPNSLEITRAYQEEIKDNMNKLQNMAKLCKRFIPADPVSEILSHAMDNWRDWRMVDISFLFGEILEVPAGARPPPGPLPPILVRSLKWLLYVMNSPLFQHCWDHNVSAGGGAGGGGGERIQKIADVRRDWEDLFMSIKNRTISFPQLEVFIKFLKVEEEFELFFSSTAGRSFKKKSDNELIWNLRTVDKKALSSMKRDLMKFAHLQGVLENIERIEGCLPFFKSWVNDLESVGVLQSHVVDFKDIVKKNDWSQQKLSDYPKFAEACEIIHPSLLQLHPALFQKILESLDIFEWLRTQSDDQDFQRGIELAMGRSEMECPTELWLEDEDGGGGRVNEQILAMLRSVRSYLHSFIYREDLMYKNAQEFVMKFLAQLGPFRMTILDSMDTCNASRLPLIELLSGGTESAAPDRLLRMLQPSSEAIWSCESDLVVRKGGATDDVAELLSFLRLRILFFFFGFFFFFWILFFFFFYLFICLFVYFSFFLDSFNFFFIHKKPHRLKYVIPSKKETISRHLTVNEVEDFQSTVVLSRTDQRAEDTRAKITNFVESFGWMKQYATFLLNLHSLGHFEFDKFDVSIPLCTDAEEIREKALNAKGLLNEWEKMVSETRFFLSFFIRFFLFFSIRFSFFSFSHFFSCF